MWIVLPLALVMAGLAVIVFAWAVRSGQIDDLVRPSLRVLVEDEGEAEAQRDGGTHPAGREQHLG